MSNPITFNSEDQKQGSVTLDSQELPQLMDPATSSPISPHDHQETFEDEENDKNFTDDLWHRPMVLRGPPHEGPEARLWARDEWPVDLWEIDMMPAQASIFEYDEEEEEEEEKEQQQEEEKREEDEKSGSESGLKPEHTSAEASGNDPNDQEKTGRI